MADDWFGIGSTHLDSHCGSDSGDELSETLDGDNRWDHSVTHVHWFVIDLGQTYTIKKVRGRSNSGSDPIDVNIYIDNSNPPTTLCEEGITTWQVTEEWVEITLTTEGTGRYIKVEIEEADHAFNWINWGKGTPYMTIFDASPVPSAANPLTPNLRILTKGGAMVGGGAKIPLHPWRHTRG